MADPGKRTLLLVEDEALIAQAQRVALEGYGYTVLISGTGERAIEMVEMNPAIDLVLMDIDLGPGIDGTEAAARILKDHDLPIVFLSSHTEPAIVAKVERITSYGYVVKDSSYVVLNASIRMAFRLFEANRAVRLSHETFKGMINSVTEAIYVQDEKGVFLDINDRCVDFYGIPREQVIGRTPDFLSAPGMNDLTPLPAIHARAFGGEPQTIDFWGLKADGTAFPKEVTLSPGTYFGQKVVIAVARDVTNRKKREQELRETTQLLGDVTENMFDVVVLTDRTGGITYTSRSIERLGYNTTELAGRNVFEFVHPDDHAGALEGFRAMISDGAARQLEFRYRNVGGTYLWFEVLGRILTGDASGIPARCIFSGREVTERRLTNERLRENEAYLKAILENSFGSIWAIDQEYKILYVNEVFASEYLRVFGIQLQVGEEILPLLPDALRAVWKQRYERALNNERFVFEDKIESGGHCVFIEVAMNPIVVDGQVVGASCHGTDITEQKTAEIRIHHETRLRELLIELSTRFINQPSSALGTAIRTSLAKMGEFVGADRAYVFSFDRAAQTGSNTYEWCREGIAPQIDNLQNVPFNQVDPLVQLLNRGKSVHVASTADLPPGSHRELLEVQKIKSLLNLPLMKGNECIGMVGFDSVVHSHEYSQDEQELLHVYAEMLVNVLERQQAERSLHESEEKYHRLFSLFRLMSDTMPDMLWAKDLDKRFIFANKAFCRNLLNAGDTSEPVGKTDMFFAQRERESRPDDPSWHTFGELCMDSDAVTLQEMREMQFDEYGNVKGAFLYLDVHKAPLLNDEGELIGVVGSARDITARKHAEKKIEKQLAESELLLKEVHHRIRNNITSISSLLTMQSRSVTNPEAVAILQDAIARVGSMKVLYERLLNSTSHETASVKPFVEGLISSAAALFPGDQHIRIMTEIDDFELRSKKLFPFGIIITELLTNALKYAFAGRAAGEIHIRVGRQADQVTLSMSDDGIGLPEDFDPGASAGFGLLLIRVLSEQLDGTYSMESRGGTKSVLTFGC
jgi:PAS domain S-box-containing protein